MLGQWEWGERIVMQQVKPLDATKSYNCSLNVQLLFNCGTHKALCCVVENSAWRTLQGPSGEAGAAGEAVQSPAEGEERPQQPAQPPPGAGRQRDHSTSWSPATRTSSQGGRRRRWGGGGGGGRGRRWGGLATCWWAGDRGHPRSSQTTWTGPSTGCYWPNHYCYEDKQPAYREPDHRAGLNTPTRPVWWESSTHLHLLVP